LGNFQDPIGIGTGRANPTGTANHLVPDPDFKTVNIALGDGQGALGSVFDVLSPPSYPTEVWRAILMAMGRQI